ncbi:MAG: histidinol-phosphate transaminase [Tissierellales bacterium]|nr:histidinol-phosphate transaminase [Tissierellales bacterium]
MIELKQSVRKLKPYFVNQIPYQAKLDANETKNYLLDEKLIIDNFQANIYPDSDATQLRNNMASFYGCKVDNIMVGNGSSEMINTVINGFCEIGDKVLSFNPSFSMYSVYCDLAGAEYVGMPLNEDFSTDAERIIKEVSAVAPKIVLLCNPNNPTGYYLEKSEVIKILDSIKNSVVILDEAYIDFGGESCVDLINQYENLIVMRTLSKAFGLAALRVGCLITNEKMLQQLWSIKSPYNVNALSQWVANKAFEKVDQVQSFVKKVADDRDVLAEELKSMGLQVYPSKTNYIYFQSERDDLFEKLCDRGVLIRKMVNESGNFYRISIGNKEENDLFIKALEDIL